MIKQLFFLSSLLIIMIACGESHKTLPANFFAVTEPRSCSQVDRNQFIYDVLKDSYLWSDKVGDINISLNVDDQTFLNNFLYKKKDKFSFVISQELFNQQFNSGEAKDLGFLSAQRENAQGEMETIVAFVYPNSPADKAGLKRSDKIYAQADNNFRILTQMGTERTVQIKAADYNVSNVLYQREFAINQKKVGYFLFKSFIGPHLETNLDKAFARFKAQGVSELIVDLRYNGGGLLRVASHLGALIGGNKVKGHILQHNRYNTKYSYHNSSTFFDNPSPNSLQLKRVIFLTTQNSASASESLINGLRARENNIEVITIGRETYGKPYGMHTMAYCDKVLVPIHFADENSEGVGDFVDGLAPTCLVNETFKNDFADQNETLLSNALYFIAHNECQK